MAAFIDVGFLVSEKLTVPVEAGAQPVPSLISTVAVMSWGSPMPFVAVAGDKLIFASTTVT